MSNFLNQGTRTYNLLHETENYFYIEVTYNFSTPLTYKQYKLTCPSHFDIEHGTFNVNNLTDSVAKSLTFIRLNPYEYIINGEVNKITFRANVSIYDFDESTDIDDIEMINNNYAYQNNAVNAYTQLNDKYIYMFTYGTLCSGVEMVNVLRDKINIKVDNYDIKKQPIFIRRMTIPNYRLDAASFYESTIVIKNGMQIYGVVWAVSKEDGGKYIRSFDLNEQAYNICLKYNIDLSTNSSVDDARLVGSKLMRIYVYIGLQDSITTQRETVEIIYPFDVPICTLSNYSYQQISNALKEAGYPAQDIDNYMPNVNL